MPRTGAATKPKLKTFAAVRRQGRQSAAGDDSPPHFAASAKRYLFIIAFALLHIQPASLSYATPDEKAAPDWTAALHQQISAIDAATDGNLGVYIKSLGDERSVSYAASRPWYLSSTTKVPVAIALLQKVEAGELGLEDRLTLREADYVDGAGDLLWTQPGTRFSVADLLEKMMVHSDSTATDMLIRMIGEEELNQRIQQMVPEGFGPVTTLLQVREDAYGEVHPRASMLSNLDFLALKSATPGEARMEALLAAIGVKRSAARVESLEEAFERYYQRGRNSSTLEAYGDLLEKLVAGEYLTAAHTALILEHMESITTGGDRIQAGLPDTVRFAQKTGTQVRRICNIGIVRPQLANAESNASIVVAACVEKFSSQKQAEGALRKVGEAMKLAALLPEA
jgi:beta-lactamase class A